MILIYKKNGNIILHLESPVEDSKRVEFTEFLKDLINNFGVGVEKVWLLEIQPLIYHARLRLDQIHRVMRSKLPTAKIYGIKEEILFILKVLEFLEKNYSIVKI